MRACGRGGDAVPHSNGGPDLRTAPRSPTWRLALSALCGGFHVDWMALYRTRGAFVTSELTTRNECTEPGEITWIFFPRHSLTHLCHYRRTSH